MFNSATLARSTSSIYTEFTVTIVVVFELHRAAAAAALSQAFTFASGKSLQLITVLLFVFIIIIFNINVVVIVTIIIVTMNLISFSRTLSAVLLFSRRISTIALGCRVTGQARFLNTFSIVMFVQGVIQRHGHSSVHALTELDTVSHSR